MQLLFLAVITPIWHDFYNYKIASVEYSQEFIHFLKVRDGTDSLMHLPPSHMGTRIIIYRFCITAELGSFWSIAQLCRPEAVCGLEGKEEEKVSVSVKQ